MATGGQEHWETVYRNKEMTEVGWYQKIPAISLDWIQNYLPEKDAPIIDIGGGDSFLSDQLLRLGYTDLTLLDISETSLAKAKDRLEKFGKHIEFIRRDASAFTPPRAYALWHDRAAFHFLRTPEQLQGYHRALSDGLQPGGLALMATFSTDGPEKCSGLPITQYSEESLSAFMGNAFELITNCRHDHFTPSGNAQNYVYALYRKRGL